MRLRLFLLLLAVCLTTTLLEAQPELPPRYQIYGGYSYLSNSLNGVPGSQHALRGWDASVAFPDWHNLRFKIDVSGYDGTNLQAKQEPVFILGGGQYGHTFGRETVYGQGLAGEAATNRYWAANGTTGGTASFAAYLGGGVDTRITEHIAVRIDGGYQYSYFSLIQSLKTEQPYRIPGLPTNFARASAGLVWNF